MARVATRSQVRISVIFFASVLFCAAALAQTQSDPLKESIPGARPLQIKRFYPKGKRYRPGNATNSAPVCNSPLLSYFGGPVTSNVQVVPVFWNLRVNALIQTNISQFYSDATTSSWFDSLNQYSTGLSGGTNQEIGRGSSTTGYTITPTKCSASTTSTCLLSDSDVQSELTAQIAAGILPPLQKDSAGHVNTVYMVYFPPNISLTGPGGFETSCVAGGFCAYHSTGFYSITGDPLPYGAIMDTFAGGCSVGCGSNATALENTTDVSSHELAEAVTDTDIGLDIQNNYASPAAWADNNNSCGEIGDICDDGSAGSTITVDGRSWVVQQIWSNAANACVATGFAPAVLVNLPSGVTSGIPFNFAVTVPSPPTYVGTIGFSSDDSAATLPANYTFTPADHGSKTFSAILHAPPGTTVAHKIQATDIANTYISGSTDLTVNGSSTNVITFTTNAPATAVYGTIFTVAATASSGLPVVFTTAGTFPCNNVGATYFTTIGGGTCQVIANQAGNSTYPPAAQVVETTTVLPAPSLTALQNPVIVGQNVTIGVTVSGTLLPPAGGVTLFSGANPIAGGSFTSFADSLSFVNLSFTTSRLVPGAGVYAVYGGDNNYAPSTSPTLGIAAPFNFGAVAVGTTASAVPITVQLPSGGTVSSIQAVTQGAPNLDFNPVSGGTCASGSSYTAGQTCTVDTSFAPLAPGVRMDAVQLLDSSGNLLATTFVSGQGQGPAVAFVPGVQNTVGSGLAAVPNGVAADAAGNLFIADSGNNQVVKVPAGCTSSSCQTTTGFGLSGPRRVAVDGAGNLFIADYGNNRVVEVPAGCTSSACQSTVGSGFSSPVGVAVDGAGDVFVADFGNSQVVEVPAGCTSSACQTTVGSGLTDPQGVAVDGAGDVFIADFKGNQVVEVPAGCTSAACQVTLGSGLSSPSDVQVDGAGDVFIADFGNNRVVEVPTGCTVSTCQSTVGLGLSSATSVALDGTGDVFIADLGNSRAVEVQRSQASPVSFGSLPLNTTSSPQTVTIQNIGNKALTLASIVASTNFTVDAGTTTCSASSALAAGGSCSVGVDCTPPASGPLAGTLTLTDNALNGTPTQQQVSLSCIGKGATSTFVSVFDAATGSPWNGSEVTGASSYATSTVNPVSSGGPAPTGTVSYTFYGNSICSGNAIVGSKVALNSGSVPNSNASGPLAAGSYSFSATYSGDTNYSSSTSNCGSFVVGQAVSGISVGSSVNPSTIGQFVTFTATITTVPGFAPTGTVAFYDGGSAIGTGQVSRNSATYTTFSLTGGSHTITAQYGGDSNFQSSTSATLTQVVTQASTTTTVSSSPNPSAVGQTVTIMARITSSTKVLPTGAVTFSDGAILLGTAIVANSSASLTTSSLGSGPHSIVAQYSGDVNFLSSSSSTQQVVNMGLASSPNPSVYGQTVTFTATVSAGGNPTGNVVFTSGTTALASVPLVNGVATFSTAKLPAVDVQVTATYAGSPGYPGGSVSVLQSVTQAPTTTTITGQSANPSTYGQAVTFTATVNSSGPGGGGTVMFMAGTAKLGSAPLVKGVASFTTKSTQLAAGTYAITASYSGDANHVGSASAAVSQTVNQANTTTVLMSSPNPSTYGQPVTFTATVNGGATPTGVVTFMAGTTKLGSKRLAGGVASFTTGAMQLVPGSYQVTAVYGGNANETGSTSAVVTQVVNKAGSGTVLTSSMNPSSVNQPVTLTATVSGSAGTPTGKVQFKDGTKILGTVALTNGTATLNTIFTTTGQHNLSGTYLGSGKYLGSMGGETQTVQ
jgi:hypothetical protein